MYVPLPIKLHGFPDLVYPVVHCASPDITLITGKEIASKQHEGYFFHDLGVPASRKTHMTIEVLRNLQDGQWLLSHRKYRIDSELLHCEGESGLKQQIGLHTWEYENGLSGNHNFVCSALWRVTLTV